MNRDAYSQVPPGRPGGQARCSELGSRARPGLASIGAETCSLGCRPLLKTFETNARTSRCALPNADVKLGVACCGHDGIMLVAYNYTGVVSYVARTQPTVWRCGDRHVAHYRYANGKVAFPKIMQSGIVNIHEITVATEMTQ